MTLFVLQVDIGDTSLSVTAKLPSSDSEYSLELDLAHPVTPEQSGYKVMSTKIEIKLKKAEGKCSVFRVTTQCHSWSNYSVTVS